MTATPPTSAGRGVKDDVLLVHTADGKPLPVEHGGAGALITPQLYAGREPSGSIASSVDARPAGTGAARYSNTADPCRTIATLISAPRRRRRRGKRHRIVHEKLAR